MTPDIGVLRRNVVDENWRHASREEVALLFRSHDALADALEALLAACCEDNPIRGLMAEEAARAALRKAGRQT